MVRFRTPSKGVGFPDAHDNCIIPNNSKDFWHVSNNTRGAVASHNDPNRSNIHSFFVTHHNVRTMCAFEFLYAWRDRRTDGRHCRVPHSITHWERARHRYGVFFCSYIVGRYQAWMKRSLPSSFAAYTAWRCCIGENTKITPIMSRRRQVTQRDVCSLQSERQV